MDDSSLEDFVASHGGDEYLRVEAVLGDGYVRLKSSEAERRQAIQDIRSSESILIELLRNARDASASHIFVATQREEAIRRFLVIDDGRGIPEQLWETIFEPRVTSKLNTARLDRWGMHGRGMALYSIRVNAVQAKVVASAVGRGSAIEVLSDGHSLAEKADQSTFPTFVTQENGVQAMRGPRNLVRTACEFALEHRRDCQVYFGSAVDIAATLYNLGIQNTSAAERVFEPEEHFPLWQLPSLATDAAQMKSSCAALGLEVSSRSARRILDGEIQPLPSLIERMENESFPQAATHPGQPRKMRTTHDARGLTLSQEDTERLRQAVANEFSDLAERYYLDPSTEPIVKVNGESIRITIPIEKLR